MNRTQYLNYKATGNVKVIYEYYTEKFDHSKHNPFLSEREFFPYIQMHSSLQDLYINIINYYDSYYNVITLFDCKGNVISIS